MYHLPPNSIVQDALAAAGGASAQADLSTLNLAHLLHDGDQVVVPARAPTAPASTAGAPTAAANSAGTAVAPVTAPININTASEAELESLPHVGPALAQRIIDYRTTHGAFRAIEDITQVAGIGPAIFGEIKDLITVN